MDKKEPKFADTYSGEEYKALLADARKTADILISRKAELSPEMPATQLHEQLLLLEKLSRNMSLAGQIVSALFETETQNETIRAAQTNEQRESTGISEDMLYFGLELKKWPAVRLESYAKELPQFNEFFMEVVRGAKHVLSAEEERIILLKNKTGGSVHDKLYTMITSKFTYKLTVDGKELTLTDGQMRPYLLHENREIRKAAMEAMVPPYTLHANELAELYFAMSEDHDIECMELRNYEGAMDSRHLSNGIPKEAYQALVASAHKNRHLFQKFVKIKQKILGLPDFQRWDFNAPVDGMPKGMPYEDAKKQVLDTFERFAPWLAQSAQKMFEENRIDVYPRSGKRSGAFCVPMVPGETPLVLLNHNDSFDAVLTMAHELGHAVHQMVSKEHSILVWNAPLVLAETASVFAEQLIIQDILKSADKKTKRALLCHIVDEVIRSVASQLRYTVFEEKAHTMIREGCTPTDIDALWSSLQQEDFPEVPMPKSSVMWRSIHHIYHYPFYCYSYAFGQLLVLSLWRRYEIEGDAFVPKFKEILASGGSVLPAELLLRYGFDITSEQFWDDGFETIKQILSELEKTAD